MEPITTSILASILYDMIKCSVAITGANLRERLQNWIIDDKLCEKIAEEAKLLDLNNEMSELAINDRLQTSQELVHLTTKITYRDKIITQTHSGSGDNVAGNKIIN